jgi:hypothetical protein
MIRVTTRSLAEAVRLAKIANPAVVISILAESYGTDKTLKFTGLVTVGGV